jgi:hypothetical protein
MRRLRGAMILVALSLGCGFNTTLGPPFLPVEAGDRGVIYFYRPSKVTGAVNIAHVVVDGEERLLLTGGYLAMRVSPGRHRVLAYSTPGWQYFVTYGYGPTRWRATTEIDVGAGGATYLRVETLVGAMAVEQVSEEQGRAEIGGLELSPGGARDASPGGAPEARPPVETSVSPPSASAAPSSEPCRTHLDCKGGLVCPRGQCVAPSCVADKDCGPGRFCSLEGVCEL